MEKKYFDYIAMPLFLLVLGYSVFYKSQKIQEEQQQSNHPLREFVIR